MYNISNMTSAVFNAAVSNVDYLQYAFLSSLLVSFFFLYHAWPRTSLPKRNNAAAKEMKNREAVVPIVTPNIEGTNTTTSTSVPNHFSTEDSGKLDNLSVALNRIAESMEALVFQTQHQTSAFCHELRNWQPRTSDYIDMTMLSTILNGPDDPRSDVQSVSQLPVTIEAEVAVETGTMPNGQIYGDATQPNRYSNQSLEAPQAAASWSPQVEFPPKPRSYSASPDLNTITEIDENFGVATMSNLETPFLPMAAQTTAVAPPLPMTVPLSQAAPITQPAPFSQPASITQAAPI
eukprot:Platyproteum_vivax@DN7506_c1_g1_i7.p1